MEWRDSKDEVWHKSEWVWGCVLHLRRNAQQEVCNHRLQLLGWSSWDKAINCDVRSNNRLQLWEMKQIWNKATGSDARNNHRLQLWGWRSWDKANDSSARSPGSIHVLDASFLFKWKIERMLNRKAYFAVSLWVHTRAYLSSRR